MKIKFKSSVIFVKDVDESRKFYEGILGQKVEFDHGECVTFVDGFAIWQIDYAHKILFGSPSYDEFLIGKIHVSELYFESDDLDRLLIKLQKEGVEFVHSIFEQPWGQRVIRIYDWDKHIVEIGEPMVVVVKRYLQAGFSTLEVARKTSMPVSFITNLVE